jgi:hypothetical protein
MGDEYMKIGDFYTHFKEGTEYYFYGIALPKIEYTSITNLHLKEINLAFDAHTPKGEEVRRVQLYCINGIMLIDRETPHVVYQSEHNYDTDDVWVREVDDFFGYKVINGIYIKRFTRK